MDEALDRKLETYIKALDAMSRGEKPGNVPPALESTLVRMYADFFISETPLSHYTASHETLTPELTALKGDTTILPKSFQLYNQHDHIARHAHSLGFYNWKILGLDTLSPDQDPLDVAQGAEALILTRSDISGLSSALHILKAKLAGDPRVAAKQLIIQNTQNNFWGAVLDDLGLKDMPKEERKALGLHITTYPGDAVDDTSESTMNVLAHCLHDAGEHAAPYLSPVILDKETTLLALSNATHKPVEIADIFETFHSGAHVGGFYTYVPKPLMPKETSRTCAGNNREKLMAAIDAIRNMGLENVYAKLRAQGIQKPEKVVLVADDRGQWFANPRITKTKAFDDVRQHFNPYEGKDNPGAELSNMLNHLSWAEFQKRTKAACDEIYRETLKRTKAACDKIYQEKGKYPSSEIRDITCHVFVNLADVTQENPPIMSTFGITRSKMVLDGPKPMISDEMLIPMTVGEGRTKAQICDWVPRHSEMALSLRTAARLGGVKGLEVIRDVSTEFNASTIDTSRLPDSAFRVATIHSMLTDVHGHGIDHLHRKLPHGIRLLSGSSGKYDPRRGSQIIDFAPLQGRCDEYHEKQIASSLGRTRRLMVSADAMILGPVDNKLMQRKGVPELMDYLFLSLIDGTNVGDPLTQSMFKAFLGADFKGTFPNLKSYIDPKQAENDPSWGPQWRKYFHFLHSPVFKTRMNAIFSVMTGNINDLNRAMARHAARYTRRTPEDRPFTESGKKADRDLFRVVFYSSASLAHTTQVWHDTKALTYDCAEAGMAVRFGGGEEGLMRATAEGVHEYRRDCQQQGKPMSRHHISAIQCQDTADMEGVDKRSDYVCIHPTMEDRMAGLMNTDASVLLPGGAGSDREKAAEFLMRAYNRIPMQDRVFIIVNEAIDGYKPLDEIVRQITPRMKADYNIVIVDHAKDVLPVLKDYRQRMQNRLGRNAIYIPAGHGPRKPAHHVRDHMRLVGPS